MLTFNLKKEWFEKIKSGEKTHEYREYSLYWANRISNAIFRNNEKFPIPCCFKLGYPPRDDKDRILYGNIICIRNLMSGIDTDLKTKNRVFDIEFALIKEQQ